MQCQPTNRSNNPICIVQRQEYFLTFPFSLLGFGGTDAYLQLSLCKRVRPGHVTSVSQPPQTPTHLITLIQKNRVIKPSKYSLGHRCQTQGTGPDRPDVRGSIRGALPPCPFFLVGKSNQSTAPKPPPPTGHNMPPLQYGSGAGAVS